MNPLLTMNKIGLEEVKSILLPHLDFIITDEYSFIFEIDSELDISTFESHENLDEYLVELMMDVNLGNTDISFGNKVLLFKSLCKDINESIAKRLSDISFHHFSIEIKDISSSLHIIITSDIQTISSVSLTLRIALKDNIPGHV